MCIYIYIHTHIHNHIYIYIYIYICIYTYAECLRITTLRLMLTWGDVKTIDTFSWLRNGPSFGTSGMWCLRMWCLIIIAM